MYRQNIFQAHADCYRIFSSSKCNEIQNFSLFGIEQVAQLSEYYEVLKADSNQKSYG